jgi:hypothetical protein
MDHSLGESPAFKDPALSLVIIHLHGIDGKDLFEIDNLGILFIDLMVAVDR